MEWASDRLLLWIGAAVCAVLLLIRWSKGRRVRRIVSEGRFLWAEIIGCDSSWKVNDQTYCCFRVRYRDAGGVNREFLSDAVKTDAVHGKIGCKVKVYVSDRDSENYWIDVSSISAAE